MVKDKRFEGWTYEHSRFDSIKITDEYAVQTKDGGNDGLIIGSFFRETDT